MADKTTNPVLISFRTDGGTYDSLKAMADADQVPMEILIERICIEYLTNFIKPDPECSGSKNSK